MSTLQRKGPKQSKLASWQQLKSAQAEVVEIKPEQPKKQAPKVVVDEVVLPTVTEETAPEVELPKIVKKGKKSE